MKHFIAGVIAVLALNAGAQQTVQTPNLINPSTFTGQSLTGTWGGANLRDHVFGCCTGGPGAAVDTTPGTGGLIWFSWGPATVSQTIAINQALSGTGVKVHGFNYSYDWYNYGYNRGPLSASVSVTNNAGKTIESYGWSHAPTEVAGWNTNSGTKTFDNQYTVSSLGNITMSFSGKDDRFWAGYYGPAIANPSLSLNYAADICSTNPLSSPSCPGYAEALFTQQCTANPLYNPSCPGYATAYFTQQCSASALYNPSCPGYAEAYFSQQCSINPLYNQSCPGYAEAYFSQQCSINPLYNQSCPGYAQAYFDQQCQLNGLYDRNCPNFASAYATKQLLAAPAPATTTATTTDTTAALIMGVTDPAVSSVLSSGSATTSATSPISVIGPLSVIAPPPKPAAVESAINSVSVPAAPTAEQQQQRQQEQRQTDAAVASVERGTGGNRAQATQRAAAAAREASERAANAATLEAQAAGQALVVGYMGYVAGFSAYQAAIVPDTLAAAVGRQYTKPTVDNRAAQRGLAGANDRLHQQMVEDQYRLGR